MANVYATRSDLDDFGGLPDGALSNAGRLASTVDVTANTIELDAHGFVTDEPLQVRAVEGGSVPAPLVAGATYFAIYVDDSRFKLATAAAGPAIDLTTTGSNVLVAKPLPIDRMLEFYSRWVDDILTAHTTPLEPVDGKYPLVVTRAVALLAGKALLNRGGKDSEVVDKAEIELKAQLERWNAGKPVRDPNLGHANLAVVSSFVGDAPDPRGWGSGTLP